MFALESESKVIEIHIMMSGSSTPQVISHTIKSDLEFRKAWLRAGKQEIQNLALWEAHLLKSKRHGAVWITILRISLKINAEKVQMEGSGLG